MYEVDATIFVCGRMGSMSEFLLAYFFNKNIGILSGSGGITARAIPVLLEDATDQSRTNIILDADPVSLVQRITSL